MSGRSRGGGDGGGTGSGSGSGSREGGGSGIGNLLRGVARAVRDHPLLTALSIGVGGLVVSAAALLGTTAANDGRTAPSSASPSASSTSALTSSESSSATEATAGDSAAQSGAAQRQTSSDDSTAVSADDTEAPLLTAAHFRLLGITLIAMVLCVAFLYAFVSHKVITDFELFTPLIMTGVGITIGGSSGEPTKGGQRRRGNRPARTCHGGGGGGGGSKPQQPQPPTPGLRGQPHKTHSPVSSPAAPAQDAAPVAATLVPSTASVSSDTGDTLVRTPSAQDTATLATPGNRGNSNATEVTQTGGVANTDTVAPAPSDAVHGNDSEPLETTQEVVDSSAAPTTENAEEAVAPATEDPAQDEQAPASSGSDSGDNEADAFAEFDRAMEAKDLPTAKHLIDALIQRADASTSSDSNTLRWCSDAHWRMAQYTYISATTGAVDDNNKETSFAAGVESTKKALQFCDSNAAAHKWYAILLSELTGLQGTKVQISSAMEIKQHIDRAMELEDKDPMPPYMAGAWAFEFSNLSTVSRWFAQKLFGKLPETSFSDALGYFEMSENRKPGWWVKNTLMLGKTHAALKNKVEARRFLQAAADFALAKGDENDDVHRQEARKLLKKL